MRSYENKMQHLNQRRQSNIELLRIISMILIVFHHFAYYGGFKWKTTDITIPHFWYNLIIMGGKIGVDVFVLISGYFLISNCERLLNKQKTLNFWGQVFFILLVYLLFFR